MIFVTVGHKEFDRLIEKMDLISKDLDREVIMQIGDLPKYFPENARFSRFFTRREIEEYYQKSKLTISHCSIGSIINAMKCSKPLIMVPRYARYGEYGAKVDEHQLNFARNIESEKISGLKIIYDINELKVAIVEMLNSNDLKLHYQDGHKKIIKTISDFVESTK